MSDQTCPVCSSPQSQQFWYWEKEDTLMREWAMDTQVYFSICRNCSAIFQNQLEGSTEQNSVFSDLWDSGFTEPLIADEPFDWVQQFGNRCKEPGRALEIYAKQKRFEPYLMERGWEIQSISISNLEKEAAGEASVDPFSVSPLQPGVEYDIVFFFDVIEKTAHPVEVLTYLHKFIKPQGAIYVQTENPSNAPRLNRLCLTSKDRCIYPFRTLIWTLFKAGFANEGAETSGKTRCVCSKIDLNMNAQPSQIIPRETWSEIIYRFNRNYYWMWTTRFLQSYSAQKKNQPNALDATRQRLLNNPVEKQLIRDVCGACFLFINEIAELESTLSRDWDQTMSRIFTALHYDLPLYNLLQVGGLTVIGQFPEIDRLVFSEKMIYMTEADYFKRFFTQEEAHTLCHSIMDAGKVVVGDLSSLL